MQERPLDSTMRHPSSSRPHSSEASRRRGEYSERYADGQPISRSRRKSEATRPATPSENLRSSSGPALLHGDFKRPWGWNPLTDIPIFPDLDEDAFATTPPLQSIRFKHDIMGEKVLDFGLKRRYFTVRDVFKSLQKCFQDPETGAYMEVSLHKDMTSF